MCAAWLRLFALGSACVASRGKPDKVRVCRAGGVCEFRAPLLLVELSPMNRLTVCKLGFALNGLRNSRKQKRALDCCSKVVKRPNADRPERHRNASRRVPRRLLSACFGRVRLY